MGHGSGDLDSSKIILNARVICVSCRKFKWWDTSLRIWWLLDIHVVTVKLWVLDYESDILGHLHWFYALTLFFKEIISWYFLLRKYLASPSPQPHLYEEIYWWSDFNWFSHLHLFLPKTTPAKINLPQDHFNSLKKILIDLMLCDEEMISYRKPYF